MTAQDRLAHREATPALMRLSRALSRLDSVLTVMNTGAHPDDEQSGLLAWLRFGLGMRVVIACSTRGEGGQNALGPERTGLLGLIRTREMEEAARVLDADVAWVGFGPTDTVHDFGFSKDGDDTLARWNEALVVERMARAYRSYRPDVVLPTFLDVPGQHGHHCAMTRAAAQAIALAADPCALSDHPDGPWQVTHHYLPAWSGGGDTYDDAVPPPPATLEIEATAVDEPTGVSFSEIGQWSRRRHASQGMGKWSDTPARSWSLHRVGGTQESRLAQSLPQTLADLAPLAGPAAEDVANAACQIAYAQSAFPQRERIAAALADADAALERAQQRAGAEFTALHGHRLARKRREIAVALAEVAGLAPTVTLHPAQVAVGGNSRLHIGQTTPTEARDILLVPHLPTGVSAPSMALETGFVDAIAQVAATAPFTPVFHDRFDALGGNGDSWVEVSAQIAGRCIRLRVDIDTPMTVGPRHSFAARPTQLIRRVGDTAPLKVALADPQALSFETPQGWDIAQDGCTLTITPPKEAQEQLVTLTPSLDGRPAQSLSQAQFPHIGAVSYPETASLKILTLDIKMPLGARIAYIGSGDSVGLWLQRLGFDVTLLETVEPDETFAAFTTVLVGVVAFGTRPDLVAATQRLHSFVATGGHLVTLYQRPDLGWSAEETPPLMLKIGTPSLRWRVTNPAAAVTFLDPTHPLLNGPNLISSSDFDGWDKERGLYFAAAWDQAYQPLLSMSDAGEDPLTGALVSAKIGCGRHTHISLVLHHQLDKLVPGAFRLLANLVQPT
jgi:LmbE family N-acetylglucosaminyl deacetylase